MQPTTLLKYTLSTAVIIVVATGCASNTSTNDNTNNTVAYTTAEVSQHATETDCWMTIDQKVYNVTDYVTDHPGGKSILKACGVEASDLFYGTGGVSYMHSDDAKSLLSDYQIGVVQN